MILECSIVVARQSSMIDGKPRSVWIKSGAFADERDATSCYNGIPVMGCMTGKAVLHWSAHNGVRSKRVAFDSSFNVEPHSPECEAEGETLVNAISNAVLDFCIAVDMDTWKTEMDDSAKQAGG